MNVGVEGYAKHATYILDHFWAIGSSFCANLFIFTMTRPLLKVPGPAPALCA